MSISLQKNVDLTTSSQALRHNVLRNTYWLLALSLIPTVLGAAIGVQFHIRLFNGLMGLVLFMAVAYGFIFAIEKNKNSGLGVGLLLAFTFFMGLMLSPLLTRTLGFSNGASLIMTAFGGTAAVLAVMATIATTTKRDFSFLGQWMFAGMIVAILAGIAAVAFQIPGLAIAVSAMVVLISSGVLLWQVQQIVNGGETNYVSATLSIYISLYNIFSNLLALLGLGGERD